MAEFDKEAMRRFEDRTVAHVRTYFRDECSAMDKAEVRQHVREGMGRANHHGITGEFDVVRFIDLMFALSIDFDTSPDTPWAAPILADPDLDATTKMDRLYERAEQEEAPAEA